MSGLNELVELLSKYGFITTSDILSHNIEKSKLSANFKTKEERLLKVNMISILDDDTKTSLVFMAGCMFINIYSKSELIYNSSYYGDLRDTMNMISNNVYETLEDVLNNLFKQVNRDLKIELICS